MSEVSLDNFSPRRLADGVAGRYFFSFSLLLSSLELSDTQVYAP